MGVFRKNKEKASKEELNAFKHQLKYGADPKALYDSARAHFDAYKRETNDTITILIRHYNVVECDEWKKWSKLQIQDYMDDCPESPIRKHVYMHTFGELHPKYGEAVHCLACGLEIFPRKKS